MRSMDYLTVCLRGLSDSEEFEQTNESYIPSIYKMISTPNLFNALHKISRNQGANINANNRNLQIQCKKCERY